MQETDDAAGTANDTTTVYYYGSDDELTVQTGKTVYAGLDDFGTVQENVTQSYDAAGRQVSVSDDTGTGPATTTFAYDDDGNRVRQAAGGVTTSYMVDENNFTGNTQTLEQTDRDSLGAVTKHTTYMVGWDVIGQHVAVAGSASTAAIYLKDGVCTVRGLYDMASPTMQDAAQVSAGGAWTKVLSYDAYGNAIGFDPSTAKTELLYNSESFNAATGQQYLRSRWYDPSSGRFTELGGQMRMALP